MAFPTLAYVPMLTKRTYPRTQNFLLLLLIVGDAIFAFAGLSLGYWVRFETRLRHVGVDAGDLTYRNYLPLVLVGTAFLVGTFAYLRVYDGRLLLRRNRALLIIAKATLFWFVAFLGVSLALKIDPPVSRLFAVISFLTTLAIISGWRVLLDEILERTQIRDRLVQNVVIVGWSPDARQLTDAVRGDPRHPYEIIGWVTTRQTHDPATVVACECIGTAADLEQVFRDRLIDIAIIADLDLPTAELMRISSLCERLYVQFKIVPSFFRIFVSNLRLQTISSVPVLGVEDFAIGSVINGGLKRAVDIVGALIGLTLSAPVIATLSIIIRRESPGPVIYRQTRTGRNGLPFTIYKLRSMRLDAETSGAQWAVAGDPRRLKIGAFMREWNLDELPQFWNVLIGDMSLVGPRPERPELITKFETEVPHYNPRHAVRPGLTGWAQVNGLRGNTSLVDRIKYDLYYIENWSLWFDLQIMARTFLGNKNAY